MSAAVGSFLADECAFLAGGVAYQLFFSLIPLLALVVGLVGFVYGNERSQAELAQLLRSFYPSATAQETRVAHELVESRALSLGIGLVGTVLGASAVIASIDRAFAFILPGGRKLGFLRGRVEGLVFVFAIALVAVFSFAISYGAQAAQDALAAAGYERGGRLLLALGSPIVGLVAGWLFFYSLYRYVPRTPMPPGSARTAALVSAVLWEAAKVAFGFFTRALATFSAFGPIAFAAGLLTWVYLTAVIILFGVEYMKVRSTR